MHMNIDFPNLGIHLEDVGKTVTVFNFDIAYYGIVIGIGIVAGLAIAMWQARRTGQNPEDYIDLAMYAVIFGIIGARIYYVAFSWDMYKDDLLSILNIREGGLAIYGGVIAAVITVFVFAKMKKMSPFLLLDTAGLGLVTGQMIGRWGNFFNREVFGEYTDSLLAMRLPVDAVRSSDISDIMWNHLVIAYGRYKKFDGEVFLFYLAGYGTGRFWIEGIRTDQLLLPVVGLPVSQVLSAVLVVVSVIWIIIGRRKAGRNKL